MNDKGQKRKLLSAAITALVHIVAVLLLYFVFGLPYQDPPPPEQGVEISAGDLTDAGNAMMGDVGGEEQPEQNTEASNNDEENIVTSNEKAPISAKKTNPKRENAKKDDKPAVDNDAVFPGKKNSKGSGTGSGSGYGNGENGTGGGGNGSNATGNGYSLKGRSAKTLPNPKTDTKKTGKVVVSIKVDQEGNVVEAIGGEKGTTLMEVNIWRKCEQAAKKSKFSPKEDAPELQKGTITYNFAN
ncbi:MAG: hypothetical protein HUK18_07960 [Bacteroidales bacterium]|nr:hypothetical protein [Bacteroidales bacterium]